MSLLRFLQDNWRDILAISGVVGTLASLWQIYQTKKVATATQEAMSSTLHQTRSAFGQYAMATGRRLLNEAKIFVDEKNWSLAALRMSDLAEQAAQLAHAVPGDQKVWSDLADRFRGWESTYRRLQTGDLPHSSGLISKWDKFAREAAGQFDRHHGPFALTRDGNGD